jgi:hypothetical protein
MMQLILKNSKRTSSALKNITHALRLDISNIRTLKVKKKCSSSIMENAFLVSYRFL